MKTSKNAEAFSPPRVTIHDRPNPEARAFIVEGLDAYNVERTGIADNTPLDVTLVGSAGDVLGGLFGRTSLGVLFVDLFYLPESHRGQGHGARILAAAESEARRRGCATAVIITMVIQAPSFYEKNGYQAFGRIDCEPSGNARIYLKKALR